MERGGDLFFQLRLFLLRHATCGLNPLRQLSFYHVPFPSSIDYKLQSLGIVSLHRIAIGSKVGSTSLD
jgi:hypothetical protein